MTSASPPDDQSTPDQAPEPEVAPPAAAAPVSPQYVAPQASGAPPTYGAASVRPGTVTTAGILMIIIGALITIFGLLSLIGGAFLSGGGDMLEEQVPGLNGMAGAVAGVIIVFGLILLVYGILEIVAGANVLGGKGWARITGIVLAAIIGFFNLLSLFSPRQGSGILITLLVLAANAFIIWALATSGSWFAARAR